MGTASQFDRFLSNLQALLVAEPQPGPGPAQDATARPRPAKAMEVGADRPTDAIDRELSSLPRATAIVSLKDAPEVEAFRNELIDGLIRVDTANQLLRLANELISRMLI